MPTPRAARLFVLAALAAALVAGCSSGGGNAAQQSTSATQANQQTLGAPSTVNKTAGGSLDNTEQVCGAAEKALDLVSEGTMQTEAAAEVQRNGGDVQKAALTVFERAMGKIATEFQVQAKGATDRDLANALTVTANAIEEALGDVQSVADLDNLDKSAAFSSPKAKQAEQTLTDKCGGKFADGL